jgi:hypothetical protein
VSPNEVQVAARRHVRMVFIVEIDFISEGLAELKISKHPNSLSA